jgi:glucose-1-phosphate thymidylyltransferase
VLVKALILAAGHGTRLKPLTHASPKHMLPIANKPLLQYIVEQVRDAGIKKLGIVVGFKKEQIMEYFGDGKRFDLNITYIPQAERLGISHAIKTAKSFIGDDDFVVLLGDNLFLDPLSEMVKAHKEGGAEASIAIQEVEDPTRFGVAVLDGDSVKRLVEKPKEPPSKMATAGIYFLSKRVFDVIERQEPSARGEYEIPDSYQMLIDEGVKVHAIRIKRRWTDTGRKEDMLDANRSILSQMGQNKIDSTVRLEGSDIIEPCIIGKGCVIIGSRIGPHVSVADGCSITNSIISDSIIGENTSIDLPEKISDSIIGKHCRLRKTGSANLSLLLADNSTILEQES